MLSSKKNQVGFTLIEMIVSLAIFSIIVTITIGALLVLIASNQKLQGEQSVMTNLAFAMDSMTREIRTGTNYYCENANNENNNIFDLTKSLNRAAIAGVQDCKNGRQPSNHKFQGILFTEAGESITGTGGGRILYYFDQSSSTNKMIKRRVGNGTPQPIVSSGLVIENAEFFVSGPEPESNGDLFQPTVTIHITAKEIGNDKKYYLQTTVTQRTLDL